ncbi:MAG: phage baseplate protein [Clostridiales bacterium]|nr:phage baseplate protein [Clostridiales bacterium]
MRKFFLHNSSRTKSFDLNTAKAFATEPSGLGNSFSTEYKESDKGKHLVNVKPNFDPITLKIYFNADGTDGYANYKGLMLFLEECGKSPFLFEYNDGVTDKYCDVILKSSGKSEKDSDGVFCEPFTFERQSYWYERLEGTFELENTSSSRFPLGFPFGFSGRVLKTKKYVSNPFHIASPITITISGQIRDNIRIYIATLDDKIVSEIKLSTNCEVGKVIVIEPNTKKITITENGVESNGYGLIDKTKQSFLYLPKGDYYISSDMTGEDKGKITFTIKRYLLD